MFLSVRHFHCSFLTLPEISGWANPVLVLFQLSVACHSAGYSSIKSLKNIKYLPGARCHASYWEDKASKMAMVIAHVVLIIQWRIQRKQKTKLIPSTPCLHWIQIYLPARSFPSHHLLLDAHPLCQLLLLSGFLPRPSFCSVGNLIPIRLPPPSMCLWCQFSWSANPWASSLLEISSGPLGTSNSACSKSNSLAFMSLL